MPYPGIDDKETIEKLDRCVTDVMRSGGYDKGTAIAICRHSIGASLEEAAAMLELRLQGARRGGDGGLHLEPVGEDEVHLLLGEDTTLTAGEIMKFTGAVLCRAEVNRNNDGITSDGIVQLANSLPLMPIDVEHMQDRVVGMFTAARAEPWVREDGTVVTNGALVTDGIIYARRFPEVAEKIVNGEMKLSVECTGRLAVCGACGTAFTSAAEYCEHMLERTATRWLFDLSARGGGVTTRPAGTDTVFSAEGGFVMIAALDDYVEKEEAVDMAAMEELQKTLAEVQARVAALEQEAAGLREQLQQQATEAASLREQLQQREAAVQVAQAQVQAAREEAPALVRRALALARVAGIDAAEENVEKVIGLDANAWDVLMAMQASRAPARADAAFGIGDDRVTKVEDGGLPFIFAVKEA